MLENYEECFLVMLICKNKLIELLDNIGFK